MILKSGCCYALLICGSFFGAAAQQQQPAPAAPSQTAPSQTVPNPSNPNAKVLFSRSDDQTADQTTPQNAAPTQNVTAKVTDVERAAITFTSYDLDIHLAPRDHTLSARALLDIRNDSSQSLNVIPLQLSSSLNFEGVSLDGKRLPFAQQILNSDTDHTGQLREAVIALPAPLAPKAALHLEVTYSGTIEVNAKRLEQLGTPEDVAAHSDWDRISEDFTGLRGFGNVVWYPVASVPALLGDGAKVFTEISAQKLRQSNALVSMRLTIEYYLAPPTAIVLDGHPITIGKPSVTPTQNYPGVITSELPPTKLGFAAPSLFLSNGSLIENNGVRLYARSDDQTNAQGLMTAATMVQPLVTQWLCAKPKSPLTVIDLPEQQDLTWEQGPLLLTGIIDQPPENYAEMMSHGLAHAYFQSPREWLNEGVPSFIETLWIEHTSDRTTALAKLESQRSALAFAEPATPGAGPGEDLLQASNPVYYRTKATYVLWMLSDIAGEKELASAFQAYDPAADTTPDYFQKLVERASNKDLQWFFDNWVYNDRGLPDLSIAAVHSTAAAYAGQYLVAIDISNDGFAETEVPITVRSHEAAVTDLVRLPGKTKTVHRMLVQGQPETVIVNDGTVPEVAADVHQHDITEQ